MEFNFIFAAHVGQTLSEFTYSCLFTPLHHVEVWVGLWRGGEDRRRRPSLSGNTDVRPWWTYSLLFYIRIARKRMDLVDGRGEGRLTEHRYRARRMQIPFNQKRCSSMRSKSLTNHADSRRFRHGWATTGRRNEKTRHGFRPSVLSTSLHTSCP